MDEMRTAPSGLVERVARAIDPDAWDTEKLVGARQFAQAKALRQARAAIEAMREPTEAMILAHSENGGLDFSEHVKTDWRAMIDAALSTSERSERSS